MIFNLIGLLYVITLVSKLVFRELFEHPKPINDDDIEEII